MTTLKFDHGARHGCLARILLALSLSLPPGAILADEAASDDPLQRLVPWHDRSEKVTWYEPELDYLASYDFKIYPAIAADDSGGKRLTLRAIRKSDRGVGLKSLEVTADGHPVTLPLNRRDVDTDRYGCRVVERVSLEGQEDLIRSIAGSKEVEVAVAGQLSVDRFRLTDGDLNDFHQVLAAYDAPPEPEVGPEAKTGPGPGSRATNPKVIPATRVKPVFPEKARRNSVRGRVTLQAVIREDGTVGNMKVLHSTAWDCGFEAAAMSAVLQWRYTPAIYAGKPVEVYITVDVDFDFR